MKITASRLDDLREEKRKYEEANALHGKKIREEEAAFREAQYKVTSGVKEDLERNIPHFQELGLECRVDTEYHRSGTVITVKVDLDDSHSRENIALRWDFNVKLDRDTGDVIKQTGSWSGLKAVTEDQLDELQNSLDALKYLNRVDWKTVLNKELPKYEDYRKTLGPVPGYENGAPDFDKEILAEELNESVGQPIGFRCRPFGEVNRWSRDKYVFIVKVTPARYQVGLVDAYSFDNASEEEKHQKYEDAIRYLTGVNKSTLISKLYKPLQKVEVR